jgi:hypothetical protein
MEIAVLVIPLIAVALMGAAVRAPLPHGFLPGLFALMVASISLGYVAAAHGWVGAGIEAAAGAVAATVALATTICVRDAQLTAIAGFGDAALLGGLHPSPPERWRAFEHDFWAYVSARGPSHRPAPGDDA